MSKSLPDKVKKQVKAAVFARADAYGYATRGRVENGHFMDELVDDPEIGAILREYMARERVRTYIKDGILNTYTKQKSKQILRAHNPVDIICQIYGVGEANIQAQDDVIVCCSSGEKIFVIGRGTVLKWETALRKALEFIARSNKLRVADEYPSICLQLAVINDDITEGDKTLITQALAAVGVRVYFCMA